MRFLRHALRPLSKVKLIKGRPGFHRFEIVKDQRGFRASGSDFQDPQGINHSLAALYKLLASGRISPSRATGLAYIASLLLRTLPVINSQFDANKTMQYEIDVPPWGRVGCSEDETPQHSRNLHHLETSQCPQTTARKSTCLPWQVCRKRHPPQKSR